jgi:hypothetical protein
MARNFFISVPAECIKKPITDIDEPNREAEGGERGSCDVRVEAMRKEGLPQYRY